MKIGIFGCSADPFTPAHKAIVDEVLSSGLVDKVLIAPTVVDYHRSGKTQWLSDSQKLEVIMSFWPDGMPGNVAVYDTDIKMKAVCADNGELTARMITGRRYVDTLVAIKASFGIENEYYTIIGTDSARNFASWCLSDEILKLSRIAVVMGRDGNDVEFGFPYDPVKIDGDFENVSATKLRNAYASEKDGIVSYVKDVRSGEVMKVFARDRLTGRIVFFDKDIPCLYVSRGKSFVISCSDEQTGILALIDGKAVTAIGKVIDETFALERVVSIEGETRK